MLFTKLHSFLKILSSCSYKYPIAENKAHNDAEDKKALANVEELIESYGKKGSPVAGMIIEPIQGEGGDNRASDEFYRNLRDLAARKGMFLNNSIQDLSYKFP